jgi:predicted NAD-dependent protein-ADP-ribosyltransferase YbiA (DUF1768 family)
MSANAVQQQPTTGDVLPNCPFCPKEAGGLPIRCDNEYLVDSCNSCEHGCTIIFSGAESPLSNLFVHASGTCITIDGKCFRSSEHAYQYFKLTFLKRTDQANAVFSLAYPRDAMMLGKLIAPGEKDRWMSGPAFHTMRWVLAHKAYYNDIFRFSLQQHPHCVFMEATRNQAWGTGFTHGQMRGRVNAGLNPCLDNPGSNWMGQALSHVAHATHHHTLTDLMSARPSFLD